MEPRFEDPILSLLERLLALGVARGEAAYIVHRQQLLELEARSETYRRWLESH